MCGGGRGGGGGSTSEGISKSSSSSSGNSGCSSQSINQSASFRILEIHIRHKIIYNIISSILCTYKIIKIPLVKILLKGSIKIN